ncbi:PLP-dependent transferase [Athelia psychrophila]|uniref:PLP-dependent transferase n=1 Tax=Athelia psychrophila TaxID=1759441 RepID=A0A166FDR4_9AGAM|nr:PLP-dependent transferase [Fibularhizoctonia sp. CBS 109695]
MHNTPTLTSCVLHKTPITPPVAVAAQGIYFDLEDGRRIMDGVGGAAVACIGSAHPVVVEAIREQAGKVNFTFHTQLTTEPAETLAKILIDDSKGAFAYVGFVAGGTEAMEAAMKTARQYFYETGQTQRSNFIGRKVSYHGASLGTLGVASNAARRAPYECILDQKTFHHVSPAYARRHQAGDETEEEYVERLRSELEAKFIELGPDTVIAFVAETVSGASSGVVPPPKGYFKAMKAVCDKYGALLILDEIMCGMGRVGTLHAWETYGDGVSPDIQAVAKGLGGGYTPMGAILLTQKVAEGMRAKAGVWQHGYTYQAHPLCCAASVAVQRVIKQEGLLANITTQGALLGDLLRSRLLRVGSTVAPYVYDIRGRGGFWAVEFDVTASPALDFGGKRLGFLVEARCFQKNLMIMGMFGGANLDGTLGDHCMFAPAYNITSEEIARIVDIFVESVEEVIAEGRV